MTVFDPDCRQCPRLSDFLDQVKRQYPEYFARPVRACGSPDARLCIVGLAPGMPGANATGRPFTGDFAGILLYQTLYKYGFSSQPQSRSVDDGLQLIDCRNTNAVKCLPPQNKPLPAEIKQCNHWLAEELAQLPSNHIIIALGGIAHKAVIRAHGLKQSDYSFSHGNEHALAQGVLIDSYHCSRYNTQTKRLTAPMFEKIFARARALLQST